MRAMSENITTVDQALDQVDAIFADGDSPEIGAVVGKEKGDPGALETLDADINLVNTLLKRLAQETDDVSWSFNAGKEAVLSARVGSQPAQEQITAMRAAIGDFVRELLDVGLKVKINRVASSKEFPAAA